MRWQLGRRSENVEDRRGMGGGGPVGGGGFPLRIGGRGLGVGGTIVVLVLAFAFDIDPRMLLDGGVPAGGPVGGQGGGQMGGAPPGQVQQAQAPGDDRMAEFVRHVLGSTEDTWRALFAERGGTYREPTLVLFSDAVRSGCGTAQSSVGPFYCPADQKLYIDLSFYRDLQQKLGAPGDTAQAYVIAHEVGHHVQTLLGVSAEVREAQRGLPEAQANALSVKLELQADCLAGVWAHHADRGQNLLEPGDLEEALGAAAAVGDDRLQARARGHVVPDSFTHGSSAQRTEWFGRGYKAGDMASCDTFAEPATAGR